MASGKRRAPRGKFGRSAAPTEHRPVSMFERDEQPRKQDDEVSRVVAKLATIEAAHRAEPNPVDPDEIVPTVLPNFYDLVLMAERHEMDGIKPWDGAARRAARTRAHAVASKWARALQARAEYAKREENTVDIFLLRSNHDGAMASELRRSFATRGRDCQVLSVKGDQAALLISAPGLHEIPEAKPAQAPDGTRYLQEMSLPERAAWSHNNVASQMLLTGKEAFFSARGLQTARIFATNAEGRVVMATTLERQQMLMTSWARGAWEVLSGVDPQVQVSVSPETYQLQPIKLSHPDMLLLGLERVFGVA